MITALLPMKAHSERVPNKNFKLIEGKPLFAWMLATLCDIDFVDRVIINTDASLDLFGKYLENPKIVVRDRKQDLRGDLVSMNKIIEDDVLSDDNEIYLMTHTTNPLISKTTCTKAVEAFTERNFSDHDSLFTATKFQGRFYYEGNVAINHDPKELLLTQDLPSVYLENSCMYLFDREIFLRTKTRIGKKPMIFETPQLESIDIDTEDDWLLASLLLSRREID
jgi:CMP-N-acetylneuraminic acid synthetase